MLFCCIRLFCQISVYEFCGSKNLNTSESIGIKKMFVAGYYCFRGPTKCCGEELIIVGIITYLVFDNFWLNNPADSCQYREDPGCINRRKYHRKSFQYVGILIEDLSRQDDFQFSGSPGFENNIGFAFEENSRDKNIRVNYDSHYSDRTSLVAFSTSSGVIPTS